MCKYIALLFCFVSSQFVLAEPVELFHCTTPIFSLDQDFQQGSLVVVKIYYDKESRQASLVDLPAVGPRQTIYSFEETERLSLSAEASSAFFSWSREGGDVTASMVYMGDLQWGLAVSFDEQARRLDSMLPEEGELMCREQVDFLEYSD